MRRYGIGVNDGGNVIIGPIDKNEDGKISLKDPEVISLDESIEIATTLLKNVGEKTDRRIFETVNPQRVPQVRCILLDK